MLTFKHFNRYKIFQKCEALETCFKPVLFTCKMVFILTFQGQGKIQPFNVSISSSALLLIDLHSHLNLDCVCGYLAGQWDLTSHNLAITHIFPCLTDLKDPTAAEKTETRLDIL